MKLGLEFISFSKFPLLKLSVTYLICTFLQKIESFLSNYLHHPSMSIISFSVSLQTSSMVWNWSKLYNNKSQGSWFILFPYFLSLHHIKGCTFFHSLRCMNCYIFSNIPDIYLFSLFEIFLLDNIYWHHFVCTIISYNNLMFPFISFPNKIYFWYYWRAIYISVIVLLKYVFNFFFF